MGTVIAFFVGMFIGAIMGIFCIALVKAGKDD